MRCSTCPGVKGLTVGGFWVTDLVCSILVPGLMLRRVHPNVLSEIRQSKHSTESRSPASQAVCFFRTAKPSIPTKRRKAFIPKHPAKIPRTLRAALHALEPNAPQYASARIPLKFITALCVEECLPDGYGCVSDAVSRQMYDLVFGAADSLGQTVHARMLARFRVSGSSIARGFRTAYC